VIPCKWFLMISFFIGLDAWAGIRTPISRRMQNDTNQ
jgi:hypothetical protein